MQFQPVNSYKVFLLLQDYVPSVKSIKFLVFNFTISEYELAWTKKQETMML